MTTVVDTGSSYRLYLRIGSVAGVDTVNFSVTGNNAGLTPTPVAGTPTIRVDVRPSRPATTGISTPQVFLRADSSSGLLCQAGGCGSTVIPFNKIRWVASNNSGMGSGDIQNGQFNGAVMPEMARFTNDAARYCTAWSPLGLCLLGSWVYQSDALEDTQLQFIYVNDVVYPAGTYRGTVRFTATMM